MKRLRWDLGILLGTAGVILLSLWLPDALFAAQLPRWMHRQTGIDIPTRQQEELPDGIMTGVYQLLPLGDRLDPGSALGNMVEKRAQVFALHVTGSMNCKPGKMKKFSLPGWMWTAVGPHESLLLIRSEMLYETGMYVTVWVDGEGEIRSLRVRDLPDPMTPEQTLDALTLMLEKWYGQSVFTETFIQVMPGERSFRMRMGSMAFVGSLTRDGFSLDQEQLILTNVEE